MAYSEDHIALAAEYALGTLDADERAQVETMMAVDEAFAAIVQAWSYRLGVLNQMVGSVEPRPIVWENIRSEIARTAPAQQPPALAETSPPPPPAPELPASERAEPAIEAAQTPAEPPAEAGPPEIPRPESDALPDVAPQFIPQVHAPDLALVRAPQAPVVDDGNVIRLEGRVKRWRSIASVAGALAAALLVTLSLQIFLPDALPGALRPAPRIQTVEVKTPGAPLTASAQYVALLQGQAGGPAFILTVDGATKNFTVRKVGATPEPGKSFELWLISDKLPRPRSLGVIGSSDFTARPLLAAYDAEVVNGATYAVTVEQSGGSPDGRPTSAPVFSGKLIETVPPSQPQAPAKK
ncbi:anti-sigma factor [Bradyrhizobium centrosematis]|jgi:anti-sigma-K factor RskA|uniref:anti-sigma factor n=1 Tax=Bradyrhizobium centrosematis TaxID=1300039 RepID=UPI002169B05B|nr:anti-sigma factor [Bradyrhizobium centrosematis]MCS3764864.1 anti-sigma-K factor RskA [Bradyrhizobium centrosematis]MCS3777859.1 anti-sigma-K factor RskA [Bradyrhizobium centrosematis]